MMASRNLRGAASVLVASFIGAGYAGATIIASDDFNRADSSTLGVTPVGGYAWLENEHPSQAGLEIRVEGNKALFRGRAHGDDAAATLDGLQLKNLDMSATFTPGDTPTSTNYMGGFQYRTASTNSGWAYATTGYVLIVSEDAWSGNQPTASIGLFKDGTGSRVTPSSYIHPGGFVPGTEYTLRVVANEANHKVYLNGNEIINYTDPDPLHNVAGYLGLGSLYGDYDFDNFVVSDLVPEPAMLGLMALSSPFLFRSRRALK